MTLCLFASMYNISRDWWCEQRMWRAAGVQDLGVSEPLAAGTGALMSLLALIPNADRENKLPNLFLFSKACVFILGLGTCVFHAVEFEQSKRAHMNLNILDWLPVVLSSAVVLSMYLLHSVKSLSNDALLFSFVAGLSWLFFLIIAMDSETYAHLEEELSSTALGWGSVLNAALLLPLIVTLFAYSVVDLKKRSVVLWCLLLAAVVLWAVNYYLCQFWYPLAILHALYHVLITAALLEASCLALTLSGDWEMDPSKWWPFVRRPKVRFARGQFAFL